MKKSHTERKSDTDEVSLIVIIVDTITIISIDGL